MKKENKEVKENKREVKGNNENKKGGCKMKEKEERMEKERKEIEKKKGVEEMEVKQLVKEIEKKKMLLAEKVIRWAQGLCPIRDIHVKEKGRYYPLLAKSSGKLYIIDKVQGKKISFDTLEDKNLKFVIISVLAERKEEIEKEVQEDKRKYLEGKINEIDELLSKF